MKKLKLDEIKELAKNKLLYFKSSQGKRLLKLSLTSGTVAIVLIAVFYIYLNNINKKTYTKYLQAQNLYLVNVEKQQKEENGDFQQATKLFEEVIGQRFWSGNKQEAFFYLADCLFRLESYEKSIQILKEFEKKYPNSYFYSWAKLKRALIYEQMGDYPQAIQLYEIIKEKYAQAFVAPEAFLGQARCQELTGNKEEAVKIYQVLISRYPLSSQAALAEAKLQYFSQKKA